jgi:hypothetical protein
MTTQRQIPLDLPYLKTCHLWIATPAYGGLSYVAFSTSVTKLLLRCRDLGITVSHHYLPNDSLVTRARNNLADMFMHCGWDSPDDLLLWLDGDIIFDPEDILYMLQLMKSPRYDILSAPYTRKGLHWDRIAEAARLNWPSDRLVSVAGSPNVNHITQPLTLTEPHPLLEAGTGFLLTRRKVYTQIAAAHPELTYKRTNDEASTYGRPTAVAYFLDGIDPESRNFLSEDWWFCRTWIKLGGTIHGCMWISTGHIGTFVYPMNMPAIAELLNATGGFLDGPTKPLSQEKPDATEHGQEVRASGGDGRNTFKDNGGTRSDILRILSRISLPPSEAAVPSDPGPLGGGVSLEGGTGVPLSHPPDRQGTHSPGPDEIQLCDRRDDPQ